jgi:uncharacterized protein YjbI with pentapeptide repeats
MGADLTDANLDGANLQGADLTDATLQDSSAAGADLSDATLSGLDLTEADLKSADLSDATAVETVFTRTDLTEADLTGADLTNASLRSGQFTDANLAGAALDGANLSDVDLSGADLTGATLVGVVLAAGTLDGADLSGADLTSVQAQDATFEEATLSETALRSADLKGTTGLTNESLAAALGVSPSELGAETVAQGIIFDDPEAIVTALLPVAGGQALPEAPTYHGNGAFHPAIVTGDGDTGFLTDVKDQWTPTGIRFAELVVVVLPESKQTIQTCTGYVWEDGTPIAGINRYVRTVTVRVLSARTAQTVASKTFRGSDPRQCQPEEFLLVNDPSISGGAPDLDGAAQPWLVDVINPPADR